MTSIVQLDRVFGCLALSAQCNALVIKESRLYWQCSPVQSSAAQCSSLLLQSLSSDNSQLSQWMSVIISKDSTNFAKSAP